MPEQALNEEILWQAVQTRDKAWDGRAVFGVVTTGVYCRLSCPCRTPLRRNVRFFRDPQEAGRAGLRPCLRCRPLASWGVDPDAARIEAVCAFIRANLEDTLTLATLAARAELSPYHFQRAFRAATGVTPRQYVEDCRIARLKEELRQQDSVTDAIYAAGFGSGSRVYERVDSHLGMTPASYRAGGGGVEISWASTACAMGWMMLGATDRGLCFVQFGATETALLDSLRAEFPDARLRPLAQPYPEPFGRWMSALQAHLDGSQPNPRLPLDIRATAFRIRVWTYLQSIPRGGTRSYSQVAAAIGQPAAVRAVASACAANPVALVIPCHRVIRGDGSLGGYRWGLDRKQALLRAESVSGR
ncbi:MAG: bifunctional DNA-binding transcriptional regulator/O6-methylguanine-DNA methyltransferase Ada [Acidobacteria bacterium]|nr:bifunctional DNA-binding transcriptional regulator/O6-methylguanine-DNA methyltransferase Ada [Acidobacteriota bacterium]